MCENSFGEFYIITSFFTTQLFCVFIAQKLHTFYESSLSKCKFSVFPLLGLKFTKFFISFFDQKVSFSSMFGSLFSVMRDNSFVLLLAQTLYTINKSSTLKSKFSDLPLLTLKFTKFLMPFLEPKVSFSSNFASLFSVMKHT